MCLSKPKAPTIQPIIQQKSSPSTKSTAKKATTLPPTPPPPPPPEPTPEAPVLNDDRRKLKDEKKARQSGTRALRIDLSIPSSTSGINIPT